MPQKLASLALDERSALFELQVFVQAADGGIRLSEQEQSLVLLDSLGFTSDYARDFFVNAILARVASAKASPEAIRDRLAVLCSRFGTLEKRRVVDETLAAMASADSVIHPAEAGLLTTIRALLKV